MKSSKWFIVLVVVLLAACLLVPTWGGAFSFRESEEREAGERRRAADERAAEIDRLLAVPCDEKLRKRKIALIIG
ncbi:MAG: hypothetical protein K9M82_11810, partial [Deltaproteobacteria bacterium]|nr:hypothetical protein [Deltaproteobacteria bacterium]